MSQKRCMVAAYRLVQANDNSMGETEVKTATTPLTSPVKSSRSNSTHASSAPSSVGVGGPELRSAPPLAADNDDAEKNKKKVRAINFSLNAIFIVAVG